MCSACVGDVIRVAARQGHHRILEYVAAHLVPHMHRGMPSFLQAVETDNPAAVVLFSKAADVRQAISTDVNFHSSVARALARCQTGGPHVGRMLKQLVDASVLVVSSPFRCALLVEICAVRNRSMLYNLMTVKRFPVDIRKCGAAMLRKAIETRNGKWVLSVMSLLEVVEHVPIRGAFCYAVKNLHTISILRNMMHNSLCKPCFEREAPLALLELVKQPKTLRSLDLMRFIMLNILKRRDANYDLEYIMTLAIRVAVANGHGEHISWLAFHTPRQLMSSAFLHSLWDIIPEDDLTIPLILQQLETQLDCVRRP